MNSQSPNNGITRREFFRIAGRAGVGLVISIYVPEWMVSESLAAEPKPTMESHAVLDSPWQPSIYVALDSTGVLTVKAFRSELGQGTTTALAMVLAEEMDADWSTVRIEHVGANRAYGDQMTVGSRSINQCYDPVRKAGAAVRQLLVIAAAQKWSVESGACRTEQSAVIHPDGKTRLAYGSLVNDASQLDSSKVSNAPLKDPGTFKIIGTPRMLYHAPSVVRGDPVYGMDVRVPGMLYAVVARCPVFGGKVVSFDGSKASAVSGVRRIVQIDSGVAVVADNTWAALRGRDALQVTWDEGALANWSSATIREGLSKTVPSLDGDTQTFKAIYEIPYLAHATMEPMNCTADVRADRCEVWAPTQAAQSAKQTAQTLTRLPDNAVIVHVPIVGGGFGRRSGTDFVKDAVQVAQAVGAPVQVLWTRDDDLQHDAYHPLSYNYMEAKLNDAGVPATLPTNRSFPQRTGVPTGSWRSVGNFTDAYARESFLDEVAARSKLDPLTLRLKLVPTQGQQVLQLAAEKAGWGKPMPGGQGRGIAYWALWGTTHTAQVVEVAVSADGTVRVSRVVCAVDCGQVINPDTVAQQIEGGIIFALTAALKASITIDKGRVQQRSFIDYPLITMAEAPAVEVYTIPGTGRSPTGIGEAGVPPLAPAVANAIFAATGIRVRRLPIRPEDLRRK
jgi:isoquinoline 1-oxidoreductase beta subunit